MANGYTATPGIIAGNLTVNGSITTNTDAGIRIGAAPPFVRLFKGSVPNLIASVNLGTDEVTRDSAGVPATELTLETTVTMPLIRQLNAAGTPLISQLDRTIAQSGTNVTNTGNTIENTIFSKTIPANTLGPQGALVVEFDLSAAVQGGVASNFRLRFGGVQAAVLTQTVGHTYTVRVLVIQQNATNSQLVAMIAVDDVNAVTHTRVLTAVDTTLDQVLAITAQSGAVGDSQTFLGWKVHAFASRNFAL